MTDKRHAAIGEATTICYALRFLRHFAMAILEIGSRSGRNAAAIDKKGARIVGMIDKRRSARRATLLGIESNSWWEKPLLDWQFGSSQWQELCGPWNQH
jgi:hypothetical protein